MDSDVEWDPDFDRIAYHIDSTDMTGVVSTYSPGDTKFIIYKNSACTRDEFERVVGEAVENAPEDKHMVAFGEVDSSFGSYQAVIRLNPATLEA
jgi:hypothetical protein